MTSGVFSHSRESIGLHSLSGYSNHSIWLFLFLPQMIFPLCLGGRRGKSVQTETYYSPPEILPLLQCTLDILNKLHCANALYYMLRKKSQFCSYIFKVPKVNLFNFISPQESTLRLHKLMRYISLHWEKVTGIINVHKYFLRKRPHPSEP